MGPIIFASLLAGATSTSTKAVEVRASRIKARDPSTTTTVIEGERLERAKNKGSGVGELVDTIAGARVLDLGGPVSDARLTVRGGAPGQALLIVDGVPLSSPFATGIDLGQVPLDFVERVELLRGGQGAALGDGALTGALSLTTRRAKGEPTEAASVTFGSFGTAKIAAHSAMHPVSLSASFERSSGRFGYDSTGFGLPQEAQVRDNNDARRGALSVAFSQKSDDLELRFVGGGGFREAGVPGLEQQENQLARERRGSGHGRASVLHQLGALSKIELGVAASYLFIGYDDPEPTRQVSSRTSFVSLLADARFERALGLYNVLALDARVTGEFSRSTEHGDPRRSRLSASISDELSFDDFLIFGALRIVDVRGINDQALTWMPRLGAVYEPHKRVTLKLSLGRSLRTPTIDELYHPMEAGFQGNPALLQETAWEGELVGAYRGSLFLKRDLFTARLAVFLRRVEDSILYINRNAFVIRPENVGRANAAGGELEIGYQLRIGEVRLAWDSALSLLRSRLDQTGDPLPTQPTVNFFGELGAGYGPVDLSVSGRFFSATTTRLRATEENSVAPYFRLDASAAYAPFDWLSVSLRVLNLMNDRTLQSVNQIPLPGRTFLMSFRVLAREGLF